MQRETAQGVTFGVSLGLVALIGCGDASDRSEPLDAGERDGSAESFDADPGGSSVLRDRCLGGEECDPAVLPAQREVSFLDDAGDGWQRLIESDWELAAHTEGFRCVRKTVPEDVYIVSFSPLSPLGTHHTTLEVNPGSGSDGVSWCDGPSVGGARQIQGSGVGTKPVDLPPGVAMKVARGETLVMNLHLFNTGDAPLTGTSGMWVKTVPAEMAGDLAEVVLSGPIALKIPDGRSTQSGRCTFREPATIYALGPHMHQLGVHQRVTAHSSIAGERVLHDAPYDFTHQLVHPIEPIELAAGDWLDIDCTYDNDTGDTVYWGESSLEEMCFVNVGRFPAVGGGSVCVD